MPEKWIERRSPRYRVAASNSLQVTLQRENVAEQQLCHLLDLSEAGCRIDTDDSIPSGTSVRFQFRVQEADIDFETRAIVCWATPKSKTGWLIGLSFDDNLSPEIVSAMAERAIIDRRLDERKPVELSIDARSELGGELTPSTLVDYSMGGFRIESQTLRVEPGSRLMIRVPTKRGDHKMIFGKVTWVRQFEDRFTVGSAYVSQNDYRALTAIVDPDSRNRWLKERLKYRSTQWRPVVSISALLLALLVLSITQSDTDLMQLFDQMVVQKVTPYIQQIASLFNDQT